MEEFGEDIIKFFSKNSKRLWSYNNKFENVATYRAFGERVFFEDARVFTQILKTRGTLKFSANLFLDVPVWNESIHVFMGHYLKFVKWFEDLNEVAQELTRSIEETFIEDFVVQGWIDKGEISNLKSLLDSDETGEKTYSIIVDKAKKSHLKLTVTKTYMDYLLDPASFVMKVMDNVNSENPLPFLKFFMKYEDQLEGKFKLTKLLNYYMDHKKGQMNEWQACGIGDMGYYCILDGYYTIKMKESLYDTNYQLVANGYPYYLAQTNLASLLESNYLHIDREFFTTYKEWVNTKLIETAKNLLSSPRLQENIITDILKKKVPSARRNFINKLLVEFNNNKRVDKTSQAKIVSLFELPLEDLKNSLTSMEEKVKVNRTEMMKISGKLGKRDRDKLTVKGLNDVESALYIFRELVNKKIVIGIKAFSIEEQSELLYQWIQDVLVKTEIHISSTISRDIVKKEIQNLIDDPEATFSKLDTYLESGSNLDSVRAKYAKAVLTEENKQLLFRMEYLKRMSVPEDIRYSWKCFKKTNMEHFMTMAMMIKSGLS